MYSSTTTTEAGSSKKARSAKSAKATSKKTRHSPDQPKDDASITFSSDAFSSSSDASSEPASETSEPANATKSGSESASESGSGSGSASEAGDGHDGPNEDHTEQSPADFDAWYLRQLTAEFGDDLDKVRGANDFTDSSLPVLIRALRECSSVYSEEQKRKVMGQGGQ